MEARPEAKIAALKARIAECEEEISQLRSELAELRKRMDETDRRWALVRRTGDLRAAQSRMADTGEV